MKTKFGVIWMSIIVIVLHGCTKDTDKAPPFTADFTIKEFIWDPGFRSKETYDTDSISTPEVEFSVKNLEEPNVQYEWKIGTDSRVFKDKVVMLNFANSPTDAITVSLKAIKYNQAGIKLEERTNTRTFYLRRTPQVIGDFQGYFNGVPQKAIVHIENHDFVNSKYHDFKGLQINSNIQRFDSLFSPCNWDEHLVLNQRIYFDNATVYNEVANPRLKFPNGVISFDPDTKTLHIEMTATEVSTGKRTTITFKGSKIH